MSKLPTIKNSIIFKKVYKHGVAVKSDGFILRFLKREDNLNHQNNNNDISPSIVFGFVLNKKIGTSIKRNYIKRRLKNAIRVCFKEFNIKGYYVFIPESKLYYIEYKNIIVSLSNSLKFLHNIIGEHECNN